MTIGVLPNVSCPFPHWKVEEQPKKKGDDKSAVAIVKSARQLSCVSQDAGPPDSATISRNGTKALEPIRRVRLTRAALRQANIRENKVRRLVKYKKKSSSGKSLRYEVWGQISTRDCKTRAMRPRRCVGTCQENSWAQKGRQSYILFAFWGVDFAGRIHNKPRVKRVCGRFWSMNVHGQQERSQQSRIRDREDIEKSDDGGASQRRSASKRRGNDLRPQNWIYSWR